MKNKNIWLLPTDKPSRLLKSDFKITLLDIPSNKWKKPNINIYITSDEEIKGESWCLDIELNIVHNNLAISNSSKKIILTTDQELIKDGVQPIPDDFLEWFVKNPSCEFVETLFHYPTICDEGDYSLNLGYWSIIIPKEEPKQEIIKTEEDAKIFVETMENVPEPNDKLKKAFRDFNKQETLEELAFIKRKELGLKGTIDGFIAGFKACEEQNKGLYSEEEVKDLLQKRLQSVGIFSSKEATKIWFKQYTKII